MHLFCVQLSKKNTPLHNNNVRLKHRNTVCKHITKQTIKKSTYIDISNGTSTKDRGTTRSNSLEDTSNDKRACRVGVPTTQGGEGKDEGETNVEDTTDQEGIGERRTDEGTDAHEEDEERYRGIDGCLGCVQVRGDLD